jgi:sterol desaturase/sphingolipid hydroxylase (fatty acid hydroxylase superfamily)
MGHSFAFARFATAGVTGFAVTQGWALLGALWHYRNSCAQSGARPTIAGLRRHVLPPGLLASRWTRLDLIMLGLHRLLQFLLFQFVLVTTITVAGLVAHTLARLHPVAPLRPGFWIDSLFLLSGLVARDFASFYLHYVQHKVPLLWTFHKVHHAPPTLIPATARRLHPLDELANVLAEGLLLGSVIGVQAWCTGQPAQALIMAATVLYTLINMLLFAPLRHSHIDLRLGALERVVLSPAHHQMHHSVEFAHWDRNFGSIFSFWDRLWGTFLVPGPHGSFRLGLPGDQSEAFATVLGCYIVPLKHSWQMLRGRAAAAPDLTPPRRSARPAGQGEAEQIVI